MPTKTIVTSVGLSITDPQERAILEKLDRCRPNKKGPLIKTILYYILCTEERGSAIEDAIKMYMGDENQPLYRKARRRSKPAAAAIEQIVGRNEQDLQQRAQPPTDQAVHAAAPGTAQASITTLAGIAPEIASRIEIAVPVESRNGAPLEEDDGALMGAIT